MKTLPSIVSPDWRRQGPIDDKSSPSEAYANSAVMRTLARDFAAGCNRQAYRGRGTAVPAVFRSAR
jgi:hypothetical protein